MDDICLYAASCGEQGCRSSLKWGYHIQNFHMWKDIIGYKFGNVLQLSSCIGVKLNCTWHIHRGSYVSAHVLLNLLNKLRKRDKMLACRLFYHFFATSLINSKILKHKC